ncbi:YheC/YheD family protein [Ammoniphilus sp. CFH 90114]|uniref:YheC/YheD family endospore coat-associated protein n=1 Tax=Ammoniphilus sp. CFH 90114 TaxID=2493665 RepID=UPI0013E98143|nr:YheC/YheD family protein [Ammoniphilus sp. CFH 90114]
MSHICAGIQLDEKSDFPSGTHLLISPKIQQALQLPLRSPITLQLGQKSTTCIIQTFSSTGSLVRIRKDLAEYLHLPDGIQLNMRYDNRLRRIVLGPVLGVLISTLIRTPEGIFGSASSFCKELVQGAKSKGILAYIFTLKDLDNDNQTAKGWRWENNKWVQKTMPYPDTIYNRLASRKDENRSEAQDWISGLKKKGVTFFNEHFLNKWQVHQALSNMKEAALYLPSTQMHKGYATVKEAVDKFPQVYLKPTNGSLGKGIYRITRSGNRFTCQYSTMSGSVRKEFSKLSDLYSSISPKISRIPYLVQQGLKLVRVNGNPLDFRSLVQKDSSGKWAVTSIVGRIGQDQSIVSNLARGGTIMPVAKALIAASPWQGPKPKTKQLKAISTTLAESLESSMQGHFAELGIDLAVDTQGKVWLLEINAKPSKNDDQVLSEQKKTRPSVKKLLEYVLHLHGSGKSSHRGPGGFMQVAARKTSKRRKR